MADAERVMIIGWDCAPPRQLFEQWRDELPNMDNLMSNGCYGRLQSSDPPITVPAWTSMMSSLNPGKLGFYGFRNRKRGEYDDKWIATSLAVKADRVWDILSRQGKRCCVFNVPQTYPVEPVNGVMISSFLTPSTDSDYTHPPQLKQEIEEAADGYMIDCHNFRTDDKRWLLDQIHEITEKRYKVARYLLEEKDPWDFFMMVYMGPDRIHHGFWKFIDPEHSKFEAGNEFENCILDYYKVLDEQLGQLMELAGSDTVVMVVSDHGAKRMDGAFNINDWLRREGLLTLKTPPEGVTSFNDVEIDPENTIAWAWGGYYSRVFMNVAGRESNGQVAPSEYESVRDDLIAMLQAVVDHNGRRMNTKANRPQDLFDGPYVDDAPDLLVYLDDLYWRASQDVGHEELYSFETEIGPDDAVHDYDGIFVMDGPGIAHNANMKNLQLMDVAPTVLAALGSDVPDGMEGSIIG